MTALFWCALGLGAFIGGWIVAHIRQALRGIEQKPMWKGTTDDEGGP